MANTGQQIPPSQAVPPPPVQADGTVKFLDDPKIKAALQLSILPPIIGAILRQWKISSDPAMTTDLSAWMVSTIIPALSGLVIAGRAIYRRVKAGRDPNNPAKPIELPKL